MLPFLPQAPTDYLFRHTYREGQTVQYRMQNETEMLIEMPGGAGEQEIEIAGDTVVIYKFGELTPNGLSLRIINRIQKLEMTGPMADAMPKMEKYPEMTSLARLDTLSRLRILGSEKEITGSPFGQFAASDPSNYFTMLPLPADRVKVGSTWNVPIAEAKSTVIARLESVNGGVASITLKGKMEKDEKLGESKGEDVPESFLGAMTAKTTADIEGTVNLEIATGATVDAQATISVRNQTTVANFTVDVSGKGKSTWKRM
ncbi:hypothetical protein EON81_20445 [bacterium]|nr:MAG: hypothetical protein EON81_20445 [bacterium]